MRKHSGKHRPDLLRPSEGGSICAADIASTGSDPLLELDLSWEVHSYAGSSESYLTKTIEYVDKNSGLASITVIQPSSAKRDQAWF